MLCDVTFIGLSSYVEPTVTRLLNKSKLFLENFQLLVTTYFSDKLSRTILSDARVGCASTSGVPAKVACSSSLIVCTPSRWTSSVMSKLMDWPSRLPCARHGSEKVECANEVCCGRGRWCRVRQIEIEVVEHARCLLIQGPSTTT